MPNIYPNRKIILYADEYVEKLFQTWYKLGCPPMTQFMRYLEDNSDQCKDEHGRIPTVSTLETWADDKSWLARKDLLDARVMTQIDDDLVALKVNMFREQAAAFRQVRQKAHKYLMENDFDSSASAVAAFIKASQEERIALGLSKTIQKLAQMDDNELSQAVKQLATKVSAGVIDGSEVIDEESTEEEN